MDKKSSKPRLSMELTTEAHNALRRLALEQSEQQGSAVSVSQLIREAIKFTYGIDLGDPQWGGWRGGGE